MLSRTLAYAVLLTCFLDSYVQGFWMQGYAGPVIQDSGGPEAEGHGGYRLVAAGQRLHLANGPSLVSGYQWAWNTFSPSPAPQGFSPLASNLDKLLLWGRRRSRDGGTTFEALPAAPAAFSAYAVNRQGICLAGGSDDRVWRSLDTGRTWAPVYRGRSAGFIRHLVLHEDWAFAASSRDGLAYSADAGLTWKRWNPEGSADSTRPAGYSCHALGLGREMLIRDQSPEAWMIRLDATDGKRTLVKAVLNKQGVFAATTIPTVLPDSLVTCITSDFGYLRMGTWGQGVFWSTQGNTWYAQNANLRDLHVEALAITPFGDARLFAVNKEGVFFYWTEAAVFPVPSRAPKGRSAYSIFNAVFPANREGSVLVLSNGKRVAMDHAGPVRGK